MKSKFRLLIALLGLAQGCGPDPSLDAAQSYAQATDAIVGGQVLTSEAIAAAGLVGLVARTDTTDRTGFCSGTLVSSRLVLTARHCRQTAKGPVKYAVFGQDIFAEPRTVVAISAIYAHPSLDLALVELSAAAPANYAPMAVLGRTTYGFTGKDGVAMGFGRTAASQAQSGGPGQSIAVKIMNLQAVGSIFSVVTATGKGLCFGDSGGPAFVKNSAGTQVHVGALSAGNPTCRGGDSYANTVAARRWLEQTAQQLGQVIAFVTM